MASHRYTRKESISHQAIVNEAKVYFSTIATDTQPKLEIVPFTLKKANEFVAAFHRHNGETAWAGGKFAIGLRYGDALVGVAIVGNPLSATFMDGFSAEVLRNCTSETAPKGAVSKLYAACWRIWQAMGGKRLITYTLQSETGASLRGAGWCLVNETRSTGKNWGKTDKRRWQPIYGQPKFRWEICFGELNRRE